MQIIYFDRRNVRLLSGKNFNFRIGTQVEAVINKTKSKQKIGSFSLNLDEPIIYTFPPQGLLLSVLLLH